MRARYDAIVDALYVQVREGEPRTTLRTVEFDGDALLADYDGDDLYGLEFLARDHHHRRLAPIASERGFAHLLDDIYLVMGMALGTTASGALRLTSVEVAA